MIPESFTNKNIFIEINGDNMKTFDTYFSANLQVKVNESFGEIKVTNTQFKPIIKAYVKCHALIDDTVMFYKDGYTDLRGTFNYLSLNTDQIYKVKKFYLFVSDEKMGALVKEVNPPNNMLNKKGGDYYESLQEYKQQRKDEWRALNKKRPAGS